MLPASHVTTPYTFMFQFMIKFGIYVYSKCLAVKDSVRRVIRS
jgi:hypothetical protein